MEFTARVVEASDGFFHAIPAFDSASLEIRHLNKLQSKDELLTHNEEFLQACEDEDLEKVNQVLSNRKLPILIWHATKVFESLMNLKKFSFLNTLIELGLDLSHPVYKGTLPKLVIMCSGDDEEFESALRILLRGGVIIDDSENETYSTALHIACLRFDVGVVKILLKYKANPNAVNKMKMMPINLVENEENEEAQAILEALKNAGGQCSWNNYMN